MSVVSNPLAMRIVCGIFLVMLLIACSGEAFTSSDPILPEDESVEVMSTRQYLQRPGVAANLLSLDVYHQSEPLERLQPVVCYVHGGAWSVGDKSNQISDKVNLFRTEGYIFVSINYRLSPVLGGGPDRVKFPDHNQDVAAAVRWVHDSITNYGGDPERIALLGHSAGAHLVALTGTNPDFLMAEGLSPLDLVGVASIDTEGYDVAARIADGSDAYINAFGLNPEDHERASPLFNLTEGLITPNFFVGKRGSDRRLELANDFIGALTNKGVAVQEVDGSIYSHAEINAAIGAQGEDVITPALMTFLASCFLE